MPRTALRGFRSSCEMVDRNAALPCALASATSAARSAASISTRALTSRSDTAAGQGVMGWGGGNNKNVVSTMGNGSTSWDTAARPPRTNA